MQQVPSTPTRTARFLPLALLAMLLATALLSAAPASGQIIYLGNNQADRTYGWTFPDIAAADAALPDATGDVATQVGPAPSASVPDGTLLQAMDLTGLEVHEIDDEILLLRILVAELDPAQFAREHSVDVPSYTVTFTLGRTPHRISGWLEAVCADPPTPVCEPYTSPALAFRATLEHQVMGDDWENDGVTPTRVDTAGNALEVLLPRWALHRAQGGGLHPLAGDVMTDVLASSRLGFSMNLDGDGTAFGAHDQLPDDGAAAGLYTLTRHSLGSVVGIGIAGTNGDENLSEPSMSGFGSAPIRPRESRIDIDLSRAPRIPIQISNDFGRSVLAVPDATLHGTPGDLGVRLVESLSVPSGETRRFDLILTGNATIDPAQPVRATVSVSTLGTGTPFADRFDLLIRDAQTLTPETNRLYLHTVGDDSIASDAPTTMFHFVEGILNTREDDPQDNRIGANLGIGCICGDNVREWVSEAPVLDTLHLDPDGNLTFHLTVEAVVPGALLLDTYLLYDETPVAGRQTTFDLTQGTNTFDVPLPIDADAAELPPTDNAFYVDMWAAFRPAADIPLTELTNLAHETNPRLVTDGATWLELPLVEPAARYADLDHLALDLQRGFDAVQYVNPGRAALWNVTILNQGSESDTITVAPKTDGDGWRAEARPGKSFRLAPGESVTVGVLARAPATAAEGEQTRVNVTVTSNLAKGNAAGIGLSAVVTDGIEISETAYVADNETQSRVVIEDEKRGSPAPGIVWVALALLTAGRLRGRSERQSHHGRGDP